MMFSVFGGEIFCIFEKACFRNGQDKNTFAINKILMHQSFKIPALTEPGIAVT